MEEKFGQIKIIDEDSNYLIVYKPAGVIVHGGQGVKEKTLTDVLLEKYPYLTSVGESSLRPAIVHRLDKESSGLLIIPKNQTTFDYFKELFQTRQIEKRYKALVYGQIDKEYFTLNFPLIKNNKTGKMSALPLIEKDNIYKKDSRRNLGNRHALMNAKEAITHLKVEKKFINYTYLDVEIKTGRNHQIRAHLSAFGHPIVGDNLYGRRFKGKNEKLALNRIFLEAYQLSFLDQEKKKQKYKIKLSPELSNLLKVVK
jgi:23S rRNA pseudouridine1911/1915/1917 synthase